MLVNRYKLSEKELFEKSRSLRIDVINTLAGLSTGHAGGALGMADIFACLYFNVLGLKPNDPFNDERDRFLLSNGHICPILYVCMADYGFFPKEELKTLRKINSRLQGHPHNLSLPGIENTSGPLGQGISQALGHALRGKMDNKDYRVFCIVSDAENQEGQFWEALLFANKYKLDNLIIIVDKNNIQIDGYLSDIMPIEPLEKKYEAFNFEKYEMNGNNISDIMYTIEKAVKNIGNKKPKIIAATTILGYGVPFMENNYEWHGKSPTIEEAQQAIEFLNRQELF